MKVRLASGLIFILVSLLGVGLFLYPFLAPNLVEQQAGGGAARSSELPLMLSLLVGFCLLVLLLEVQSQGIQTRFVALLGVLVAINAALRFLEVAIPGPAGFSPIFFLIILGGYVFGGRFGFMMGALTLLVSALITGGVGPWLPSQMITAGWVGMSAPLVRWLLRSLRVKSGAMEVVALAIFGAAWGFFYGVVLNLWFWPFMSGSAAQSWQAGMSLGQAVQRYAVFYFATSFAWDLAAVGGNIALLAAFGLPALRVLRRFQRRFAFEYLPVQAEGDLS
jgi:energy-coupling factor transport system substrate-specific component